jgi:hypothetical protein
MSLASDIDNLIDDIQDTISSVNGQVAELNDNLVDLTDSPLLDTRIGYGMIGSVELPVFTPGSTGNAIAPPGFDSQIPSAPSLDSVNTDITVDTHSAGPAPSIDTNIDVDNLDTSGLDNISKPTFSEVDLPDVPEYELPTKPLLDDIHIPDVPEFTTIPTFNASAPDQIAPPEIPRIDFTEEEYVSDLKQAAEAWLQNIIENGGTALSSEVEQGIFDRSRTREATAFRQNIGEASDQFAASGFPRPGGALRAKIDNIRADYQNRIEDLNRKLTEDQERLAQENTQFAISEAGKLEATKMQFHSDIMNRSLDFAKALVASHETAYNLKVTEYNTRVEAFRTEAYVHKTMLESIALEIEQYKSQIEASKLTSDVNIAKTEQYTAEVGALRYLADFYTAQMNGAKVEADIQGLYLDKYRTEVEAAKIGIDAQARQLDVVETRIRAQGVKLDGYRAEVESAKSSNDAERLKIEAKKAAIDSKIASNQGRIDAYKQAVDAYQARVYAHRAELQAFETSHKLAIENARKDSEDSRINAEIGLKGAELEQLRAKANTELFNLQKRHEADIQLKELDTRIAGASEGMRHLTTVAAAALSQMNAIVQTSSEVSAE